MNIFDILGPIMVGPSSSHTAGAVRIGAITRTLLGSTPSKATIYLHGSFAATGVGHGTDRALVAGLLGMRPDDINIPNSFDIAKEKGLEVTFEHAEISGAHPNTAVLLVQSKDGKTMKVMASSIGGGRIKVNEVDDTETNFSGENPTLIVNNQDRPGYVAQITAILSEHSINIATMQLCRDKRGGDAVMVIEMDQKIKDEVLDQIKQLDGVEKATYIDATMD